jgi:hypothetical protein
VIDPLTEKLFTLNAARCFFPRSRRGKRRDLSTIYRYAARGCRGVILEAVVVGGVRCTSREAIARFIARLTALDTPDLSARARADRGRAGRRASQELDAIGI